MPAALEGVPSPAMVREVVSGRLGTTAAAQLLGDPLRHGAAEALAPGLLGEVHNTPELVRSKFKPGRRLTGYYRLGPAESPAERHLAGVLALGSDRSRGQTRDRAGLPR